MGRRLHLLAVGEQLLRARWWSRSLLDEKATARLLARRVRHVAGPMHLDSGLDDVIAITVVRNGELHIRSFVEHHLDLGVRHIALLDTGSTDATLEIAGRYKGVTALRTDAPYARFENAMKHYLARRFARNRWHLCVDVDERFDYPHSGELPLPGLVRYLNQHSYTAVVAQMLDLFPDSTLSDLNRAPDYESSHCYYDLTAVERTEYRWGELSNPAIRMHRGGIRATLFGTQNGLTKAPLVFTGDSVRLFLAWHHTGGTRIADFTGVLLHYPFAGDFHGKVHDAAVTGRYGPSATDEYERYSQVLQGAKERRLRTDGARCFTNVDALVDEGFLVTTEQYRRWTAEHGLSADAGAVREDGPDT